ncbi:hypothetical protein BH10PLA2_BH10PLA2_06640 [soil metagenome]
MNKCLLGLCLVCIADVTAVTMFSERSHAQAPTAGQKSERPEDTNLTSEQTTAFVRGKFRETETILPSTDGRLLPMGAGFSGDKVFPGYGSAFENKQPPSIIRVDNPVAKIRMVLVTSAKAMDAEMGINVEAKARFLFGSAEAKTEYGRAASISEDRFKVLIVADTEYGTDELADATLKPHAAALLKEGRVKEFTEIYGTHYVHRQSRIAKIILTIGVDKWSDTTREKLRASLQGGVSFPLAGGDLKMAIQNDLKASSQRNTTSVEVFTIGGTGLSGFADLIKPMLANSDDFQQRVGQEVTKILKGFNRENSGIGSVTVRSYREFGWNPAKMSLWNDLFEQQLQRTAELYYRAKSFSAHIQQLKTNATPAIAKDVSDLAAAYDQYLLDLANLQKGLLAMDDSSLSEAFPKEPVMTEATAKRLFIEYATMESRFNRKLDDARAEAAAQGLDNLKWVPINTGIIAKARANELPPPEQRGKIFEVLGDGRNDFDLSGLIPQGYEVVGAFPTPWDFATYAREFSVISVNRESATKVTLSVHKGNKGGALVGFGTVLLVKKTKP